MSPWDTDLILNTNHRILSARQQFLSYNGEEQPSILDVDSVQTETKFAALIE